MIVADNTHWVGKVHCTAGLHFNLIEFAQRRNGWLLGRGGGQVVSVLDFYSDDPSSNPADVHSFFCKICVWKEQK